MSNWHVAALSLIYSSPLSLTPTTGTSILVVSVSILGTSTSVSVVPTTTSFESTSTPGSEPPSALTSTSGMEPSLTSALQKPVANRTMTTKTMMTNMASTLRLIIIPPL